MLDPERHRVLVHASRSFVCPGSTLERGAPTLLVFLGNESGDHQPAQYASRRRWLRALLVRWES
jgi:hypothetical protein